MQTKMVPDRDVGVPRSFPLSKTKAREALSRLYRSAGFANVTTPEDRAKGHERWKLYAIDKGQRIDILDCAGPPDVLPKAMVAAGYRAQGFEVEFGTEGEGDKAKRVVRVRKSEPPPEVKAAFEAAQRLAAQAEADEKAAQAAKTGPQSDDSAAVDAEVAEARIAGSGLDNGGKP